MSAVPEPGITRSRKLLFESYRASVPRPPRPSSTPLDSAEHDAPEDEQDALLGDSSTYPPRHGGRDTSLDLSHLGLAGGVDDPDSQRDEPLWAETSRAVESLLDGPVASQMAQLDRLHAAHLLPSFADRRAEEAAIDRLTGEITKQLRSATRAVATLGRATRATHTRVRESVARLAAAGARADASLPSHARAGAAASRQARLSDALAQAERQRQVSANVQAALAGKVQVASALLRKKQSVYLRRLQGIEVRGRDLAAASQRWGKNGFVPSTSAALDADLRADLELSQNALAVEEGEQAQAQLTRAPSTVNNRLEDVNARDRQVSQIAQSISELAELFEQLSALVIEQGALVDRIDWNVETSTENVQLAQRHLVAAQGHQRRSGRVQCIILLILCVMLLVTIIIVKPFFRWFEWTSPKPVPPPLPQAPPTPPPPALAL